MTAKYVFINEQLVLMDHPPPRRPRAPANPPFVPDADGVTLLESSCGQQTRLNVEVVDGRVCVGNMALGPRAAKHIARLMLKAADAAQAAGGTDQLKRKIPTPAA